MSIKQSVFFFLSKQYGSLVIFASFVHAPWFLLALFWAKMLFVGPVAIIFILFIEKKPLKVYDWPMSPDIKNHMEAKISQMAFCTFLHSPWNWETSRQFFSLFFGYSMGIGCNRVELASEKKGGTYHGFFYHFLTIFANFSNIWIFGPFCKFAAPHGRPLIPCDPNLYFYIT